MIEINLLPEDMRVHEKTVTGTRIVIFVGAPVLVILVFFWAWLHFAVFNAAEAELKLRSKEEARLAVEAKKVQELEAEIKKMETKQTTVEKLRNLRKLDWIRKLMDLTAAVNNTQGWLTKIDLKLQGGNGNVTLGCAVIGKDRNQPSANVRDFLYSLGYERGDKAAGFNAFWKGFIAKTPEDYYKGLDRVKDVEGLQVTEFTMKLEILPEVAKIISVGK